MHSFSLVYVTNIWNHYQASLCTALSERLGSTRFAMCVLERLPRERQGLGWETLTPQCDWVKGPPRNETDINNLQKMILDADVAVLGSCPQEIQAARSLSGKLTFMMSERIWKKPCYFWKWLNPRFRRGINRFKKIANRPNVHYLAMGTYAAEDFASIGAYGDRMWAWPYFADVNPIPPAARNNAGARILWAGRMLDWKRVDLVLKAAALIKTEENFERLDIVGTGAERNRLLKMAERLSLGNKVFFHEPVSPDNIREMMRQSDIYVLSSNRGEGWGVVANEAMSEGSVLVANEQAGASRELIRHGRTGFIFRDDSPDELAAIFLMLLRNGEQMDTVRQTAWEELNRLWHPQVGAERLIALSSGLLGLSPVPVYQEGPCRKLLP